MSDYVGVVSDGSGGATLGFYSDPFGDPANNVFLASGREIAHYNEWELPFTPHHDWTSDGGTPGYAKLSLPSTWFNQQGHSGEFRSDSVPEPATLGLLAAGLGLMGFRRRRMPHA